MFSLMAWYYHRLDWNYAPWTISEDHSVSGGPHLEDGRVAGATTIETPTKISFPKEVSEIYYVPMLSDQQLTLWLQLIDRNRTKPPTELSPGLISTEAYDYSVLNEGTLIWRMEDES